MIRPSPRWAGLSVADAHLHFFSHRFFSMLATQKGAGHDAASVCAELGWPLPPEDPAALAAQWVAELDRHRVQRACLIASLPGDEPSVASATAAFPDRFSGLFFVNPLEPGAPERVAAGLASGLRGICLMQAMHGFSAAEERVRPVLDAAAAFPGALVQVHCGVLTVGVRGRLGLPSPFDLRFSNPLNVHPVALRYPQLRFIIPHFGAGMFREALMAAALCPNVYLDTSSSNSWTRYHAPPISLAHVFERALDVAGPGRLLFGSDSSFFPRGWNASVFDQQVDALEQNGVNEDQAKAILGGNLIALLGP